MDVVSEDELAGYVEIKTKLHEVNVAEDTDFQEAFTKLYALDTRHKTVKMKARMFDILQARKETVPFV